MKSSSIFADAFGMSLSRAAVFELGRSNAQKLEFVAFPAANGTGESLVAKSPLGFCYIATPGDVGEGTAERAMLDLQTTLSST